jgi:ATP-dependent Clp protease ATP-binding subunit ClpX
VGRLPVVTYLSPLSREVLVRILTEPKNSLVKQFTKLFEMDGVKLSFKPDTFEYIVDKAIEFKLGARGLRSMMEAILMDDMFEMPSNESAKALVISREYAEKKLNKTNISRLRVA